MKDSETAVYLAAAAAVGEGSVLFESFRKLMKRAAPEHFAKLLEQVDESDYSLSDWIAALGEFDGWLERQNRQERPVGEMLGYIHCCTSMPSPGLGLPILKVIVYQSLTEFGFNSISDPQI